MVTLGLLLCLTPTLGCESPQDTGHLVQARGLWVGQRCYFCVQLAIRWLLRLRALGPGACPELFLSAVFLPYSRTLGLASRGAPGPPPSSSEAVPSLLWVI